MKNTKYFFLVATIIFSFACNKEEATPAYLYIKPFQLQTNTATEGANTHRITEAWVYLDDALIGAYTLPTELPLLAAGKRKITVYPGVRDNGDFTTPNIYYNCQRFDAEKTFVSGKTDTIQPITRYEKNLKFTWLEDFEGASTLIKDIDENTKTNATVTETNVKSGKKSGLLFVNKDNPLMAATTSLPLEKIPAASRVYVEVDYNGDIPLAVEIYGNAASGSKFIDRAIFRNKNEWNKAYINFTKAIKTEFASYNIIFSAALPLDATGKFTQEKGEVRIDNIKVIHP